MSTLALFPLTAADGSTDAQCTPRDLALALGRFGLDVCSNPRSHVMADRAYMLERGEDGLALPWSGLLWCNPPYSDPLPWSERLRAHDGGWAALVKLDPTTRWWANLMAVCDEWAPFRRRLAYERPGNCGSADFPSALVWRNWTPPSAVAGRIWRMK